MACKNLNDVVRILTQNGYDFLREFTHPLTKKRFLLFQALNNEDYDIAKVNNLINSKCQFYKINKRMNCREFVVTRKVLL